MKYKILLNFALPVIFVVTTFVSIFSTGSILNVVIRDFIFKVQNCYPASEPVSVPPETKAEKPTPPPAVVPRQACSTDYNQTKRDVAEGISMLIVALPIAVLSYRGSKRDLSGDIN